MKHLSVPGLAALLSAAVLFSCQKQDMAFPEEEEFLTEETRASSEPALKWESTVHWSNISWYTECNGAFQGMKVAYTSNWVYLLLKVNANDPTIVNQLKKKNEKDYYLWVYVYNKAGKQEEWYPKTTCLYEMRGWLFQKNDTKTAVEDRAAYLANADDNRVRSNVVVSGGSIYYEIAYRRSGQYAFDLLKGDRELHIAARLENSYQKTSSSKAVRQQANASYCPSGIYKDGKLNMYYLNMRSTASNNTTTTTTTPSDSKMVLAYMPNYWSVPQAKAATKLTHVNYFSAKIKANGKLDLSTEDWQYPLDEVVKLKNTNKDLKVLLTIGGQNTRKYFTPLFADSTKLDNFCKSCSDTVKEYGLDGIDIDCEPIEKEDKGSMTTLLKSLRGKLGKDTIISVAAPSIPGVIDWNTVISKGYVDYVNVMSYDMNWPKDDKTFTKPHSALYPSTKLGVPKDDPEKWQSNYYHSASALVKAYQNAGVPLDKQVLGVAFYGRGSYDYPSIANYYHEEHPEKGITSLIKSVSSNCQFWDNESMTPYWKNGNSFFGYENTLSVNIKGQYVYYNGLRGVMCWDYGQDYDFELLDAMIKGVNGHDIGDKSVQNKSTLPLYKYSK